MMRTPFLRTILIAAAVAAPLLSGCGGGPTTAPVSGVVTLDGQPLSGASVSFRPQASEGATDGSYGNTDASGKYVLKLVTNDQEGAVPGMHRVTISMTKASSDDSPTKEDLPARYNAESELTFDVPAGGTDAANFELTSK